MQCSVNINTDENFTFICFYFLLLRKAHSHSNDDILTSREFHWYFLEIAPVTQTLNGKPDIFILKMKPTDAIARQAV